MTRKSEKIANLSISILEPPSIQMTCSTTNFRLESFSPNINDTNYLHLPPPTPKFSLKTENMCYTDIPMYAMAIATNKNTTPIVLLLEPHFLNQGILDVSLQQQLALLIS